MLVISTPEELLENAEFQAAMKIVFPRIEGYLGLCLLKKAADKEMTAEDKGMYLEAHADLIYLMSQVYAAKEKGEYKPANRARPTLRNSAFRDEAK